MCITEIWTYRECGCTHNRVLPCIEAYASSDNPRPRQLPSFRSLDFSTIRQLGYNAGAPESGTNNSTSICHPGQPVNDIVHKEFLQSICDECLRRETISYHSQESAGGDSNADNPILSSEVTVELIDDSNVRPIDGRSNTIILRRQPQTYNHANNSGSVTSFATSSSSPSQNREPLSSAIPKLNKSTEEKRDDADDEKPTCQQDALSSSASLPEPSVSRGQQCSPTKQWRRRGINISREDFHISSRWSSGERQTMINFRDAMQEAANDSTESVLTKFAKKQTAIDPPTRFRRFKSLVAGIRRSMSRQSLKRIFVRAKTALGYSTRQQVVVEGVSQQDNLQVSGPRDTLRDKCYADQRWSEKATRSVEDDTNPASTSSPKTTPDPTLTKTNFYQLPQASNAETRLDQYSNGSQSNANNQSWDEHLEEDLASSRAHRQMMDLSRTTSREQKMAGQAKQLAQVSTVSSM